MVTVGYFAYNYNVHDLTGFSPSELVFGREARSPVCVEFEEEVSQEAVTLGAPESTEGEELRENNSEREQLREGMLLKIKDD